MIWLHPDCLAADNPAFVRYPEAKALFVFDEAEIAAEQWTLKRIVFLYETLLEIECAIERGDVVEKLIEAGASKIVTVASVSPRFRELVAKLQTRVTVEILPAVEFVDYRGSLDPKPPGSRCGPIRAGRRGGQSLLRKRA